MKTSLMAPAVMICLCNCAVTLFAGLGSLTGSGYLPQDTGSAIFFFSLGGMGLMSIILIAKSLERR